jgi:hypothetical protein
MKTANNEPSENDAAARHRGMPMCPFCCSFDTMEPFRREPRVVLLSSLFPRLRWRYCRSCTRHFLTWLQRTRRA